MATVSNNRIILKIVVDRQLWAVARNVVNNECRFICRLSIIPRIRVKIDTVRNPQALTLRDITLELIVSSSPERRRTKANTENSEINTARLNGIPIDIALMLAHIDTLSSNTVRKPTERIG